MKMSSVFLMITLASLACTALPGEAADLEGQGLTLHFEVSQRIALVAEPVFVTATLANASSRPVTVKGRRSERDFLLFEVTDENGEKTGFGRTWLDSMPEPPFVLEPGEAISSRLNLLDESVDYRAGTFTIRAVYQAGDLSSQDETLTITEPTTEADKAALAVLRGTDYYRRHASHRFIYQRDPEACKQIIERFPESAYAKYALYYLAWHHKSEYWRIGHLRDFEEASRLYREVVELYPDFVMRDNIHLGMGMMYLKKNDFEKAMAEFIAVIESSPGTVEADSAKQLLKLTLEKAMGTGKP